MRRRITWLALAMMLFMTVGAQVAAANVSGAIFTTLADGSRVNANIYPAKTAVYLDGGPGQNAPAKAAGLDPGWYYYQVTDPSGRILLSTDPVKCRMFHVNALGVIDDIVRNVTYQVKGKTVDGTHLTGIDQDHAELGAITVQLMPYLDTPNPGGVYKAWATPVDKFLGNPEKVDSGGTFHGFAPSWSKTDNYKVKGKPEQRLIIKKFCDSNANGVWDQGEQEIAGWPIRVFEPCGVEDSLYTPINMISQLTGVWTIWEDPKPAGDDKDWLNTAIYVDGVKQAVTLGPVLVSYGETNGETHTVVFGNVPLGEIKAKKFNDKNCSGVRDAGEDPLANVTFTLTGTNPYGAYSQTAKTGADGIAAFPQLIPGSYKLTETVPVGWLPTTPTVVENIDVKGSCSSPKAIYEFGFGNVEPTKICVFKFEDMDGDGELDTGEVAVPDFRFLLTGTNLMGQAVSLEAKTGSDGRACFPGLYPGDYTVTEVIPDDSKWVPSGVWYEVDGVKVVLKTADRALIPAAAGMTYNVTFGNCKPGCIEAWKFWDKNANAVLDSGEPPVEGWKMTLTGTTARGDQVEITKATNADGVARFDNLWPGTYAVAEEKRDGWAIMSADSYDGLVLTSGAQISKTFLNCKLITLKVKKFEDMNGNGAKDDGEPGIAQFAIHVTGPRGYDETKKTDDDGVVYFNDLFPGDYVATEIIPEGSDLRITSLEYRLDEGIDLTRVTPPTISLPLTLASGTKPYVRWGNVGTGCVEVEKYYDANANGTKNASEPPIAGIKIKLTGIDCWGTAVDKTEYTDAAGKAKFVGLWPGMYQVREILPPEGWRATTVTHYDGIEVESHETEGPFLFGNICTKDADFGTKGWWHNKNGNPLITADDIAFLNSLDPYNDATEYWSTPFADRDEIAEFIVSDVSASPHRFQLAQQLAAFILNARHYAGGLDAMIAMPDGDYASAQSLVDGATAAWQSGDVDACSSWIGKLDRYNNCDAVRVLCSTPCPVSY